MKGVFEISMIGNFSFFLVLQVKQMEEGTFIHQAKYTKELLKKFEMENAKALGTHMNPSTMLDKDENCKSVDDKRYKGMIGSLLSLTLSRLDIMFSVCLCARYQSNLNESLVCAIKRIFRYLLGTKKFRLWYLNGSEFNLVGYSNADFVGCKLDRKSIS